MTEGPRCLATPARLFSISKRVSPIVALFAVLLFLSIVSLPVSALENGFGRLPFMGYSTWNAYYCNINEDTIYERAELIVSLGLKYEYMNIYDCCAEKQRNSDDTNQFPSGMQNLTDRMHFLGLYAYACFPTTDSYSWRCSAYGDSDWYTCQMYPGSYQNEERDTRLFRETWVPFDDVIHEGMIGKFSRMANAITGLATAAGRPPTLYSICQWDRLQPWLWARNLGHSWRVSSKSKTHFTTWALMKSPLLILKSISNQTLEILKNEEIIPINQDPVVGTGPDYTNDPKYPAQYWSGQIQNGTVFMMINAHEEATDMTFRLTESPWMCAGRQYSVQDLWSHTDNGTAVHEFTARSIPAHGVVAFLLRDAGDEPENLRPKCAFYE
ncbi:glycoside hydrolase family 27 protein [Desarmillaria tabescens]|uniref:alpha-galactosidase n=1 Tax=Armillaria tabescens TaxID=1929756 RepID=A0AA39NRB7_ARMTA|nr:glycoside hydrolase family 27 protein [Desarmillaria tabescens]KAK0470255.1 glycoside hydrolase family 27 protein [Desarmillaria tabescens]